MQKKGTMGDTYSLVRLSNPEKAPLVSSIVPEMSLWSSSLWRMREKRGIRTGTGFASTEALLSPVWKSWVTPSPLLTPSLHATPHPPAAPGLKIGSALSTKRVCPFERRRRGSACLLVHECASIVTNPAQCVSSTTAWRK